MAKPFGPEVRQLDTSELTTIEIAPRMPFDTDDAARDFIETVRLPLDTQDFLPEHTSVERPDEFGGNHATS